MKILTVKIKNLNSLKGEFEIDFNSPPLKDAGIFVITGPTGAGKTTVLDAVCVGLFGRTPRLGAGESRELMTRHTGECFAEVEFAVRDGVFRSKWHQRRGRGRADGKLQPASMELSRLTESNGYRIIEERKKSVPLKIAEITGLDYARFTRSILLAQGGFAAFLNADENERADLLEKMTGMEIYSLISIGVFQRAKAEKEQLERLALRRDGLELMPSDEIKGLEGEVTVKSDRAGALGLSMEKLRREIEILNKLHDLELSENEIKKEMQTAASEQKRLQPEFARLDRHLKAMPVKGRFDLLQKAREDVARLSQSIEDMEKSLPDMERGVKRAESAERMKEADFEIFKEERERREKLISEAETRISEIAAQNRSLRENRDALQTVKNRIKRLTRENAGAEGAMDKVSREMKACAAYLEKNEKNKEIPKDLPLMRERLKNLSSMGLEKKNLERDFEKTSKLSARLSALIKKTDAEMLEMEERLEKRRSKRMEKEAELESMLAGKTCDRLEAEVAGLGKRVGDVEKLEKNSADLAECSTKRLETKEGIAGTETLLAELKAKVAELEMEIKGETEIVEQLEAKLNLEIMSAKYEKDRHRLQTGTPCPLCGAVEHPWAEGCAPGSEGTERVLKRQKRRAAELQKKHGDVTGQIAGASATLEHLTRDAAELAEKEAELLQLWETILKRLEKDLHHTAREEIKKFAEAEYAGSAAAEILIGNARAAEKEIAKLSDEFNLMEKKRGELALKRSETSGALERACDDLHRLQGEIRTAGAGMQNLTSSCRDALDQYGENVPEAGGEILLLKRLEKLGKKFADTQTRLESLQRELAPLRERIGGLDAEIAGQREREEELLEQAGVMRRRMAELTARRKTLIGDADPDEARNALKAQNQTFETEIKGLRLEKADLMKRMESTKELLKSRKAEHGVNVAEAEVLRKEFMERIGRAGFQDEKDFSRALGAEPDMKELQNVRQKLEERAIRAKTRLEDACREMEKIRSGPLPDHGPDVLTERLKTEEVELGRIQNRIGEIQGILKLQLNIRKEKEELLLELEKQKRECEKWERLNRLIGSADGKKFRKYAQGLTLDRLIGLANSHLRGFDPRYVLNRQRDRELSMEVADTYQADAVRPVNTLSGGETFLVSLALALGLSELAGGETAIDSLFLDEGFGTLDSETLETAVAALDTLRSAGKTIGIISHIESLKERIPVRIQVQKGAGGVGSLRVTG